MKRKTLHNIKLILGFVLIMLISSNCIAQSSLFLRVYNLSGKKIEKGNIVATTDSSLLLKRGDRRSEIPFSKIGYIKTHHSTGNHILLSSLFIGGLTASFLLATNGKEFWLNNEVELIGVGFLFGAINGSALGGLIGAVKSKGLFIVRGNKEAWKNVKRELDQKTPQQSTTINPSLTN